ncbi:MAG: Serine/threonine-protein kinase PknB [Verrucomicrobiota bacterium]
MKNGRISPGTQIAGFEVISYLSKGNTGEVYKAHQISLKRLVALKILYPEVAADPDFVRGFFREARSAAAINHVSIVQAFDVGVADGYHFLAMELVDGGDCRQLVAREGRLKPARALEIIRAVAEGLAHGFLFRGLTHGDIKPANILLTLDGKPKLADLGLARMSGDNYSSEGIDLTPDFAAPEVISGKWCPGDPRADIYSLGATFYYLVTGRPVFEGSSYKEVLQMHLYRQPEPLIDLIPCSSALSVFAARMLAKSPDERFSTWPELIQEISHLQQSGEARFRPRPASPNRIFKRGETPRSGAYKAGLAFAGLAAGLLFFLVAAPTVREKKPEAIVLTAEKCLMMERNGTEIRQFEAESFGPSVNPGIKACLDFSGLPPVSQKPYVLKLFVKHAGGAELTVKDADGMLVAKSPGGHSGEWLSIAIPRPLQPRYDGRIRLVISSPDSHLLDCAERRPLLEIGP